MTEYKRRLLSLLVAASILFGAAGCSNDSISRKIDPKGKVTYTGKINLKGLESLFIVEIKDLKEEKKLYLCKRSNELALGGYDYELLGTSILLANSNNVSVFKSEFGKVINVIPFKQFWSTYIDDVTQSEEIAYTYNAQVIFEVFEHIKSDYDELIRNDNVKKLELK